MTLTIISLAPFQCLESPNGTQDGHGMAFASKCRSLERTLELVRGFSLSNFSQRPQCGRVTGLETHERKAFDQVGRVAMLALRRYAFDQYGRVASLGLKRRAPTLEPIKGRRPDIRATNKGHRPKNRHSLNGMCFVPGVLFSPWAWLAASVPFLGCSFAGPGPVCFLFLFLLLAAGVTFQLLEGGTSGQTQGHRPKNRFWAPTQGPALSGIPLFDVL